MRSLSTPDNNPVANRSQFSWGVLFLQSRSALFGLCRWHCS
jgi:hypothetical protein